MAEIEKEEADASGRNLEHGLALTRNTYASDRHITQYPDLTKPVARNGRAG